MNDLLAPDAVLERDNRRWGWEDGGDFGGGGRDIVGFDGQGEPVERGRRVGHRCGDVEVAGDLRPLRANDAQALAAHVFSEGWAGDECHRVARQS